MAIALAQLWKKWQIECQAMPGKKNSSKISKKNLARVDIFELHKFIGIYQKTALLEIYGCILELRLRNSTRSL